MSDPSLFSVGNAVLSLDGLYRYSLTRELGGERTCTFVMLNPSTADGDQDDPTIRRCIRFTRDWGFGRLQVVNLFAYRATDPTAMYRAARDGRDIIGPENDEQIARVLDASQRIVVAWGAPTRITIDRARQFAARFAAYQFWAIGCTALGSPRHPLYVRADVEPFRYVAREAA